MLKNNHGITLTVLVVTIIVIIILASIVITTSNSLIKDTKSKSIVSNMYLVKAKAEAIYDDYNFAEEGTLPGTQVAVSSLSTYGVSPTGNKEDDEAWYRWNKSNLETLGLDPEMLPSSGEYIVNYSTGEVIYTLGNKDDLGNTRYTLTQMTGK